MSIPVIERDETASTNTDAMAAALSGHPLPVWVMAHRQTAGRGRSGRAWVSEPGNLHASLALTADVAPTEAASLSLVAGVAVVEALRSFALGSSLDPLSIRLKWPNDILIGRAKVGGILIETTRASAAAPLTAVIGIGLNLAHAPPPGTVTTPTAALATLGLIISPCDVIDALSVRLLDLLPVWEQPGGTAVVIARWLAAATPIGEPMSVNVSPPGSNGRPVFGAFAGLDAAGALLLDTGEARPQHFTFGDVTLEPAMQSHELQAVPDGPKL